MKFKAAFISILFALAFATEALAQDTYEYAMVYTALNYVQVATKDGVTGFKIEKGQWISSEVIKKVNEMAQQGWDVYTSTAEVDAASKDYVFFLRRKPKQ